jgi:hypothetical protein
MKYQRASFEIARCGSSFAGSGWRIGTFFWPVVALPRADEANHRHNGQFRKWDGCSFYY